ncbi:MAG: hypothetical protein WBG35_11205 [Acidobacteriaceae bacterium]
MTASAGIKGGDFNDEIGKAGIVGLATSVSPHDLVGFVCELRDAHPELLKIRNYKEHKNAITD